MLSSALINLGNGLYRVSKRYFSEIGKTKIGDLPQPLRQHVQAACEAVEKLDPRMAFVDIKGQEHPSTTVPGTQCVTVQARKIDPESDEPGSRWGTMHIHSDGSVQYGPKALKSLETAKAMKRNASGST